MEMNYPELFRQGLCDAAEKWSDIIIDSKNDTPARDEGPAFFIPQGFPHIDWIPGVSHCIFGCPSLAEGYSLSLAYFVNEYCFTTVDLVVTQRLVSSARGLTPSSMTRSSLVSLTIQSIRTQSRIAMTGRRV